MTPWLKQNELSAPWWESSVTLWKSCQPAAINIYRCLRCIRRLNELQLGMGVAVKEATSCKTSWLCSRISWWHGRAGMVWPALLPLQLPSSLESVTGRCQNTLRDLGLVCLPFESQMMATGSVWVSQQSWPLWYSQSATRLMTWKQPATASPETCWDGLWWVWNSWI